MSEINITKGKLLKNSVEVEYTSTLPGKKPKSCSEESDNLPKQSLITAFDKLAIHAALCGEFINPVKNIDKADPELIKDFKVTGFSLSESKKNGDGVILTGHKTLSSGKILGFNTPTIHFEDDSENAYPHMGKLVSCIETCKDEIRAYLNCEYAEDPQTKLAL